jgi:hypothetical protein
MFAQNKRILEKYGVWSHIMMFAIVFHQEHNRKPSRQEYLSFRGREHGYRSGDRYFNQHLKYYEWVMPDLIAALAVAVNEPGDLILPTDPSYGTDYIKYDENKSYCLSIAAWRKVMKYCLDQGREDYNNHRKFGPFPPHTSGILNFSIEQNGKTTGAVEIYC